MSFVPDEVLGKSTINNIKNNTWSVHTFVKLYEDEGRGLVAYVKSLEDKIREYEEKENEDESIHN